MQTFGSFYDFTSHVFVPLTGCYHMGHSSELLTIHLFRNFFQNVYEVITFCFVLFGAFGVSRPVIFSPLNGPICVQPYILLLKSIAVQICSTIVWRHISLYPMFTCEFIRGLHIHIYTQLHHRIMIDQVLYISLSLA